jgi:hypothetical protein
VGQSVGMMGARALGGESGAYGRRGNLPKSGVRFWTKASRPS